MVKYELDPVGFEKPALFQHDENIAGVEIVNVDESGQTKEAEDDNEEAEDSSSHVRGLRLVLLTLGLCLAAFVVALDYTIISTAIPKITTTFDSLQDVGWYGSSYLLTTTALQPSFGKINTYFSVKWVWLGALFVFEVGSTVCATAPSSTVFILGRAVAGAGAAAIFSGALTILAYSIPLRSRSLYLALVSSMFGVASVVGPVLGGVLTDRLTWRWCVWINLPLGALAALTVLFFFADPTRHRASMTLAEKFRQIDIVGAILLISAIVCLLLALQWGGISHPWHDGRVVGCLVGFGLLMIAFCAVQRRLGDRATMPPRILGQRTIWACALFAVFLTMAQNIHIYYLPFYFQAIKGRSAESGGIHMIPYLVCQTVSGIATGGLITYIGYYNLMLWAGISIFTVGCGLLYTLQVSTSAGHWIGYEIVAGFGVGSCLQIPFIATQVVLKKKDVPVGNALAIFFDTLGGALSISMAENVFANTLVKRVHAEAPGVDPYAILDAGATQLRAIVPQLMLPRVLAAYDEAVVTTFLAAIVLAGLAVVASVLVEWKSVKGVKLI